MIEVEKRIESFVKLGQLMMAYVEQGESEIDALQYGTEFKTEMDHAILDAKAYNPWFTEKNIREAILQTGLSLSETDLRKWLRAYNGLEQKKSERTIAVIMAGNIPLVGFHDYLSVLVSGNKLLAKTSTDDRILLPLIHHFLLKIEPGFEDKVKFTDGKIEKIDAVIATGSNNTSRYFEYYFSKYPHIIRKNRTSVAVLTGEETEEEMVELGEDVFRYFGLGCRNVSKLYLPEGYDLNKFFKAVYSWADELLYHNKYTNNYDYYKAIYLMNKEDLIENGFLLLRNNSSLYSPVSVLNYEFYADISELKSKLLAEKENIQCIVSNDVQLEDKIKLGAAQKPRLWDYADGVDTLEFLINLN